MCRVVCEGVCNLLACCLFGNGPETWNWTGSVFPEHEAESRELSKGSRAKTACHNRSGRWLASQRDWLTQVMRSKQCPVLVNPCYENLFATYGDWPLLPVPGKVDN
jgi:hypothetical protein